METGHPSTRAVNSGSGNRALLTVQRPCSNISNIIQKSLQLSTPVDYIMPA